MTQFTASLWGDEAWAATLAIKSLPKIVQIVARDTSPPLYYLLLHSWMKIFGSSEPAIRSLSFLFFLFTGFIVFLIGKQLKDRTTGFLASLLTFTNPFLFQYAFEGRMYSLLLLTSTLSIYFFLKKQKLGFILATTAALYTHHFAIFIVFWEGIWSLIKKRSLLPFVFIGLLYLPWLYPLYSQTKLVAGGFWLGKPTLKSLAEIILHFLVGMSKGIYQYLALGAIGITLLIRRWQKSSLFVLGWFLIPILTVFTISRFFQSIFFDRYLLIIIPAMMLLIATARRKKFSLIFILVTIFSLIIVNYQYFLHPTKRPFRELATFIKANEPNLTLINYNASAHHLWESKYYGLNAPIFSPQPLPFYTGTALMEKGDVISQLPNEATIGVITSAPSEEVKIPNYHQIKSQSFGELSLLWMLKN